MRTKEDNLLKLAEKYEETFSSELDDIDEKELNSLFAALIRDYGRIHNACSKDGIDAGDSEVKEYKEDFKVSTAEEKEELISRVQERIACLAEACDSLPKDIAEKYAREKDLVELFNLD